MTGWIKNHFIPGEHNEHRPHGLRKPAIRAILGLIVFVELLFVFHTLVILPHSEYFSAVITGVMTSETNVDRVAHNLPALKANPLLEEAARRKAEDMAAKGYFAHTAPDGTAPWKWIKEVGYYYVSAGENLAINFVDSKDVTDAWMNSPAHRANILNEKFTEVGIGTAEGTFQGKQTTFVVQFFGKPYDIELARLAAGTASSSPTVLKPVTTPTAPILPKKAPLLTATKPKQIITEQVASTSVKAVPATTSVLALIDAVPAERDVTPPETELLTREAHAPNIEEVAVLGLETTVGGGEITSTKSEFFASMFSNPRRATMGVLMVIATMLIMILLVNVIMRFRTQRFDLISNGLALVAIVLFALLVNDFLSYKDLAVY